MQREFETRIYKKNKKITTTTTTTHFTASCKQAVSRLEHAKSIIIEMAKILRRWTDISLTLNGHRRHCMRRELPACLASHWRDLQDCSEYFSLFRCVKRSHFAREEYCKHYWYWSTVLQKLLISWLLAYIKCERISSWDTRKSMEGLDSHGVWFTFKGYRTLWESSADSLCQKKY